MLSLFLLPIAFAEDLHVSSNVRGAAVFLNGADTGVVTPAHLTGVAPGRHTVTVEGACARGDAAVDVRRGESTRVSVYALEQGALLTVLPTPPVAALELDGAPFPGAPGTPVPVNCGTHTLRASLDGYIPSIVSVDLAMGAELTVPMSLTRLGMGAIELSVQPRNATLYLDGTPVGTDAVTLPSVSQGAHVISAELEGYQPASKRLVVEDGAELAFHFALEKEGKRNASSRVSAISRADAAAAPVQDTRAADAVRAEAEREERAERDAAAREEADRQARARREAEAREEAARDAAAREEAEREARARREAEAREEAEREARARRATEARSVVDDDDTDSVARADIRVVDAAPQGDVTKSVATIGCFAGGIVGAGASVVLYDRTAKAYDIYGNRVDDAGNDRTALRKAEDYYDAQVVPRRNAFYGASAGTVLLLAGGVTTLLLDADGGPVFAPVTGGALLGWTVGF